MPRSAASIQAEIDILETELQSTSSLLESGAGDGVQWRRNRAQLEKRLDKLYVQLGRANGTSPMIVRGKVLGNG